MAWTWRRSLESGMCARLPMSLVLIGFGHTVVPDPFLDCHAMSPHDGDRNALQACSQQLKSFERGRRVAQRDDACSRFSVASQQARTADDFGGDVATIWLLLGRPVLHLSARRNCRPRTAIVRGRLNGLQAAFLRQDRTGVQ